MRKILDTSEITVCISIIMPVLAQMRRHLISYLYGMLASYLHDYHVIIIILGFAST